MFANGIHDELPCCCSLTLQFKSDRDAQIASSALNVDEELQAGSGKIWRSTVAEGHKLHVNIRAQDERLLRLSLTGFLEFSAVVIATLDEFST